ncbi:hypothetical protein GL279_09565 [Paracoccus limosus]|jgi:hypothetical protein|uniref:Succinate dehydrogenase n=1 Tax=Paracoccus limosus TaxID=913252 RepID=A0A844H4A7_9RHOB|nr:hypothetical protein [Paracoccus limosus]MTH34845.1 hypothetical protein [Paracoccus limosus]
MRLPVVLTVAALALSGCVVQNPGGMPPPANLPPPVVTPNPDAAVRSSARVVINREMARRLPGANVAPYTDCVLQNATTAELADIAQSANASGAVASVVGRPATTQCIAGAAAAAKRTA